MQPIISTEDLSRWYNAGKRDEVRAVDRVSLRIEKGEWAVFGGPSGSGKTTLLGLIGTLDRPTRGKVLLRGKDVTGFSDVELSRIRRTEIGIVFQDFHLLRGIAAWENVAYPLIPAGIGSKQRYARATSLMERLDLGERINHSPEQLSGGEQQRIAIARALINAPSILIADEPTSNIDASSVQALLELLQQLQREGKTILVSSHDPVFKDYGDVRFCLERGALAEVVRAQRSP
ncbi:MAG: ABC transporter ATP-binding protein [Thermodesulfobacteriota bacterium]